MRLDWPLASVITGTISSLQSSPYLVDLEGPEDLGDEPEGGEEADGARQHEEGQGEDEHVREVEEVARGALDVQLLGQVPDAGLCCVVGDCVRGVGE